MNNQEYLNNKFTNLKDKMYNNYQTGFYHSGLQIANLISDDEQVIDIGCGINPFKGKIKNLTGIDPCDIGADVVTTLENFKTEKKFDVALCLGSINFGDEEYIAKQIAKLNSLLKTKARVYWRIKRSDIESLPNHNYPWTLEKLNNFAKKYNFKQLNCHEDSCIGKSKKKRWYCEWHRD